MDQMRISQLADAAGLPASTLRYYDSAGLLPSERTPAGYRTYGPEAIERLDFINAAKNLGLPLGEIAQLLDVWQSGACAEVKADLRPRLAVRLSEAEHRAREMADFAASLRAALAHLDALPDRAERCDSDCGFLTHKDPAAPVDIELGPRPAGAERWRSAPIACSLDAQQLAARTAQWRQITAEATRSVIQDGVRLTLPIALTGELAALAADEQRCCPFFDFRLHLDGLHVHLEVRAPYEAQTMLDHLLSATA